MAADITVSAAGGGSGQIAVFDLSDKTEFERLKKVIVDAWEGGGTCGFLPLMLKPPISTTNGQEADDGEIVAPASLHIPEMSDLLGIDPFSISPDQRRTRVRKAAHHALRPAGYRKDHASPPRRHGADGRELDIGDRFLGTGDRKTSSGAISLPAAGSVTFIPGVLLRRFDRPLIIDELNRCDIDKVIGPLFTVLSGQQTTLPYRLEIEDKDSPQYVILPENKPSAAPHEFAPGPHWRLLATINSIDKAALYQMSYALARRFGWVYVDAPRDTTDFIEAFLRKEEPAWEGPAAGRFLPHRRVLGSRQLGTGNWTCANYRRDQGRPRDDGRRGFLRRAVARDEGGAARRIGHDAVAVARWDRRSGCGPSRGQGSRGLRAR